MSKAFTRESDDEPEDFVPPPRSALPMGAKNYITPSGAQQLRAELERLIEHERPVLTAPTNDPNTLRLRRVLDQRIHWLDDILESVVVVDPASQPPDQVRFGATVMVRNKAGETFNYRIVGVDETDVDQGWISWLSPIAKALLNRRVGERTRLRLPGGDEELELLRIDYENPPSPTS